MTAPVSMEVEATAGAARRATLRTARGAIRTPCFMPVGTRGAVKLLDASDLEGLGAQVVLANTYHLMLRPGAAVVEALGGIHRFTGWSGHVLTDSGGFQVFSLSAAVDDDGVTFRSTYDGSWHRLRPEDAVSIQEAIGSDIQMVLDVCTGLPSAPAALRLALERSAAWAARAKAAHRRTDQALFGIVQGGDDLRLRRESAERTVAIGFDGYGIGGLSVGEPRPTMLAALEAAIEVLPKDRPRYLMGVGDPVALVEAIARGVDLFDCVLPTRLGRHGNALTGSGRLSLRLAAWQRSDEALDPTCTCPVCARYPRGYLRHLLVAEEPTGARLISLHNLHFLLRLAEEARDAVLAGTDALGDLRRRVAAAWEEGEHATSPRAPRPAAFR